MKKQKQKTPKMIATEWWVVELKRLNELRQQLEISNKTLGLMVGISFGQVYKWMEGSSIPSVINYMIIKNYLEAEIANKQPMKLSERTKLLVLQGAKVTGSMLDGYCYAEESLYMDEVGDVQEFCKWIDDEVGGCSEYNIDRLYECWKNPTFEANKKFVEELRDTINKYRAVS